MKTNTNNIINIGGNKAITLISLVITIIVLLILAGVTINLTIGQNGIFKTAQIAAKNYTNAQNKELADLNNFEEKYTNVIEKITTNEELVSNWEKYKMEGMTIEEIVQDEKKMAILMNEEKDIKYMIENTQETMNSVLNSNIATKQMAISEKAMNAIKNNTDWKQAILNNTNTINVFNENNPITIPELSSNTAQVFNNNNISVAYKLFNSEPSGSVYVSKLPVEIGYNFEKPIFLYQIQYKHYVTNTNTHKGGSAYIMASKDGTNYEVITDAITMRSGGSDNGRLYTFKINSTELYQYVKIVFPASQYTDSTSTNFNRLYVYGK